MSETFEWDQSTDSPIWLILPVNPEAWRVGPLTVGRSKNGTHARMGRDPQLYAYEQAVSGAARKSLGLAADAEPIFTKGTKLALSVWFWRQRDEYLSHQARTVRKNEVDGTNMLKATEDALQGVIYHNDKDNLIARWSIVEQSTECENPRIVACIQTIEPEHLALGIPENIWAIINNHPTLWSV